MVGSNRVRFHRVPGVPQCNRQLRSVNVFGHGSLHGTRGLGPAFHTVHGCLTTGTMNVAHSRMFTSRLVGLVFYGVCSRHFAGPSSAMGFHTNMGRDSRSVQGHVLNLFRRIGHRCDSMVRVSSSVRLSSESVGCVINRLRLCDLGSDSHSTINSTFRVFVNPSLGNTRKRFFAPHGIMGVIVHVISPSVGRHVLSPTYNDNNFLIRSLHCI